MKLPNFLVAGFPKCGSTSLHYYFNEHPDIYMPSQKELHFFTYEILIKQNRGKGDKEVKKFHVGSLKEYQNCFKKVSGEKAVGDVSPSYANYSLVIPKIKETLGPDVKIIVIVRDPIKRAFSNYLHLLREGREELSFYDALLKEEERKRDKYSDFWYYTFNSFYADKIEHLKAAFDEVLVITFEEFIQNPKTGIKGAYEFLGVCPEFEPDSLATHFNEGGVYRQNPVTKFIFRPSRMKSIVKQLVPITPKMKQAKLKVIKKYKEPTPSIDEKAEAYLIDMFKDDVRRLKNLGVKTEYWNEAFQNI